MVTKRHHIIAVELCKLAAETAVHIERLHPGSKIVEGVSLPETLHLRRNHKVQKLCVIT
jgi:hypothetical protein